MNATTEAARERLDRRRGGGWWGSRRGRPWLLAALAMLILAGVVLRLAQPQLEWRALAGWLPWFDRPTVTLYFPDRDGRFLVPVTREIDATATPTIALAELWKGPRDTLRLRSPTAAPGPGPTIHLAGGVATVALPTVLETPAGTPEALRRASVRQTLTALPGVETVRFLDESTGQGPVTARAGPTRRVYFAYGPYVVPVQIDAGSAATARALLQAYLNGADRPPDLIGLPTDIKVLDFRLDTTRGLLTVNFTYTDSVRALALAAPALMRRILVGLIATLTQPRDVTAVMLSFEGRTRLGLGGCSDLLRAPQIAPAALNAEQMAAADTSPVEMSPAS